MKKNYIFLALGILGALGNFFGNISQKNSIIISGLFLIGMCAIASFELARKNSKKNILSVLGVGSILFILEALGAQTGIIYGDFIYHEYIPLQLFGTPLAMLGIWGFLVYEWYQLFFRQKINNALLVIILTAIGIVSFDLVIDPGAAHLGLWYWVEKGPWFGIPISNFIGWFIMSSIGGSLLLYLYKKNIFIINHTEPHAMVVSFISLGFWTSYHFLHGIPSLGILGTVISLVIIILMKKEPLK